MNEIEDRYAYYRRCRKFRRNGEQCKAPAVKGCHICYKHLEQAEMQERWRRQRLELLSRPGLGLGDFDSIQRTIRAAMQAVIDGSIDSKVAGRLAVELQTAIKLLRIAQRTNSRSRMSIERLKLRQEVDTKQNGVSEKQVIIHESRCSARQGRPRARAKFCSSFDRMFALPRSGPFVRRAAEQIPRLRQNQSVNQVRWKRGLGLGMILPTLNRCT